MGNGADGVSIGPVPFPKLVPDLTPAELIMEQLQVPVKAGDHKAANKRLADVENTFKNLSASDAEVIHARLLDFNDPLSKKFFRTFQNSTTSKLLDVLEARIQSGNVKTPQALPPSNAPVAPVSPTNKKAEIGLEGAARQNQLQGIFRDRDVIVDRYPEAKEIVEHGQMPLEVKKERLQKLMANLNKDQFKQLISDSEKWPENEKTTINAAIAESEKVMKRVAEELSPNEQARVIERSQFDWGGIPENQSGAETLEKRGKAYAAWLENTPALNLIMQGKPIPGVMDPAGLATSVADDIRKSPKEMELLDKLSDSNKLRVLTEPMKIGDKISDSEGQVFTAALRGVDKTERNATIDLVQETGQLANLLRGSTISMEGLTPQNAGVISAEYYNMAGSEKDSEKLEALKAQMHQIDAYAENHYNKDDYNEYLRIRDHYHR